MTNISNDVLSVTPLGVFDVFTSIFSIYDVFITVFKVFAGQDIRLIQFLIMYSAVS
jgi:hypothetical protein